MTETTKDFREERLEFLNKYDGVPSNPFDLGHRMVGLGRQLGKTTELVKALPLDGMAYVVVHSMSAANHIKDMIVNYYGRPASLAMIKNLKFIIWQSFLKRDPRLCGLPRLPAFVDNCVLDVEAMKLVEEVNHFFNPEPPKRTEKHEITPEEWKLIQMFRDTQTTKSTMDRNAIFEYFRKHIF